MKKITFLATLVLFGNLWAQKELPNIIVIYADDLGYGSTAPYGNKVIKTPNLDRLAAQGMLFTQHYSSAPVCAPARGALLTGKHTGHAYIRGNYELGEFDDAHEGGQMPLPEGTYTLPEMLKNKGYITGGFGKWGLGMPNNSGAPTKQGFDYFYGILDQKQAHNYYPTHLWRNGKRVPLNNKYVFVHTQLDPKTATDKDFEHYKGKDYAPKKILDEALNFIEQHKSQPFFVYFASPLPHASLEVPDEYRDAYVGKFKGEPEYYYGQKGYAPVKYPYSSFAAMITYLDMQVGKIMDKVKALGLEKNTIILFSSDNGGSLESGVPNQIFHINGKLRGFKQDLYEGGIREPFIVSWPGKVQPNSTSNLISAQYDLMATLADIVGGDAGNTDGISFLATLLGKPKAQKPHEYLYWEFGAIGGSVAVRIGQWKGIKNNLKKNPKAPWEVYNLNTDPSEEYNVASQHPELIKKLEAIVKKEHQNSHLREWEFINSKIKK